MTSSKIGLVLQILGVTSAIFVVSEGLAVTLTPDQGTTFNISRTELTGSKCAVCSGGGLRKSCSSSVVLRGPEATAVEFTCPHPEELFTVRVCRDIVCTSGSCSEAVRQTDSGSRPLQSFARSFSWTLRTSGPGALLLDFSPTGLTQIQPAQACPDQHTYSLQAFQSTGTVVLGTYCRGGSVSGVQLPRLGQLSLELPGGGEMKPAVFPVAVGEDIKSLAVVTVTAPGGSSSTELFSPNYPDGFPDDDLMEWRFAAQPKYSSNVTFLAASAPRCLKKEAGVGYQGSASWVLVLGLDDPQPTRIPGSFSLTLRNCEVDQKQPGLSLHLLVSTTRGSPPALCSVDLRNQRGVALHVQKTAQAGPDCELKLNSDVLQEATALSGSVSLLAFQSCLPHHLLLTASKLIECSVLKDCPAVALTIPPMPSCLPAPLHSVTWLVRPPRHAAVELLPGGGLTQLHPGDHHQCHGNVTLTVVEGDGTPIGHFCPQGAVGKVQVHANVTITADALEGRDLRLTFDPVINISFSERISERYIFTVSLKTPRPLLLSTPGGAAGMKPNATVSWLVSVPPQTHAVVRFLDVSQPRCQRLHTNIQVQCLGSLEEMYSRREDEEASTHVTVTSSFYLNMSNCHPETGLFQAVTEITLLQDNLLTTILGVAGALLVVTVTVLAVVCLVRRKKKKQLPPQVSIYNPNGTIFLPGLHGNPKVHEDDEAHVYASIEDTALYGPLLRDGPSGAETDTYRTFTGTTPPSPGRGEEGRPEEGGPEVGTYQPFLAPPLPGRPASHLSSTTDDEVSV